MKLRNPSQIDVTQWRKNSDFFFAKHIQIENDFRCGLMTKRQRDIQLKKISQDWGDSIIGNSPFIEKDT